MVLDVSSNLHQVTTQSSTHLNVAPLIDHFKDFVTHVVDPVELLKLSQHTSPVILSSQFRYGITSKSVAFQRALVGLRAFRCLVTIWAAFAQWITNTEINGYIPQSCNNPNNELLSIECASVHPQSYFILTDNRSSINKIVKRLNSKIYVPLVVTLSLPRFLGQTSISAKLECAKCQKFLEQGNGLTMQRMKFACSSLVSCAEVSKELYEEVGRMHAQSFWGYHSNDIHHISSKGDADPFQRDQSTDVESAIANFLIGGHNGSSLADNHLMISKESWRHLSVPADGVQTGMTAGYKFVTTAGVYFPRSSYHAYFTMFSSMVWCGLLVVALATFSFLKILFQTQKIWREEPFWLLSTAQVLFWMLSSTFGHYKDANIPIGESSKRKLFSAGIVVACWFLTCTLFINVHSAVFSSVATSPYVYHTNYSKFFDLPLMQTYALVNPAYEFDSSADDGDCVLEPIVEFCNLYENTPAPCKIWERVLQQLIYLEASTKNSSANPKTTPKKVDAEIKLRGMSGNSAFVRENLSCILQVLHKPTRPFVFLIQEPEVQRQWDLLAQAMEINPKIKLANNFADEESFLAQQTVYFFNAGLHNSYRGSVLSKMKRLMSSGIHALWQKWDRIRFVAGGLKNDSKTFRQKLFASLSFDNSGTLWLFEAQTCGWLLGIAVVILEITLFRLK